MGPPTIYVHATKNNNMIVRWLFVENPTLLSSSLLSMDNSRQSRHWPACRLETGSRSADNDWLHSAYSTISGNIEKQLSGEVQAKWGKNDEHSLNTWSRASQTKEVTWTMVRTTKGTKIAWSSHVSNSKLWLTYSKYIT